jgi:nicotinamide mononucleotide transporter
VPSELLPLLTTAFELWGSPVSYLELVAVALSLAMVMGNLRVKVWAWPLAIAASACYALLFAGSQLYGETALQVLFIGVSIWGWTRWKSNSQQQLAHAGIGTLTMRQRWLAALLTLSCWPLLGLLLDQVTDSDVPFADALATVASVTGQCMLAAKRLENWWVWLAVNLYSIGLFAYKQLWLTAALYAVFALLSWWGWRAWQARLAQHG